jgi:hypothetical protein
MADDPKPTDETQRRTEGPTPNGGEYAIAYFLDKQHRPCTEERAKYIEIHEFKGGQSIHRTWLEGPD